VKSGHLVFLDESGVICCVNWLYGWAPIGEQAIITQCSHGKRLSFVGAMAMDGPRALMVYEGTMNTACMLTFTKTHLVPSLNQGDTVVMDRLSIHKNTEVGKLIESAGEKVLILPAYSPELNPIEHLWSTLKARMRAIGCSNSTELAAQVHRIWKELPLRFYANWFKKCGYPPAQSA
jgi:transposase